MKVTIGWGTIKKYTPTCLHIGGLVLNNDWNDRSRMNREVHVRFCERLRLKCPCLLDFVIRARTIWPTLAPARLHRVVEWRLFPPSVRIMPERKIGWTMSLLFGRVEYHAMQSRGSRDAVMLDVESKRFAFRKWFIGWYRFYDRSLADF